MGDYYDMLCFETQRNKRYIRDKEWSRKKHFVGMGIKYYIKFIQDVCSAILTTVKLTEPFQ